MKLGMSFPPGWLPVDEGPGASLRIMTHRGNDHDGSRNRSSFPFWAEGDGAGGNAAPTAFQPEHEHNPPGKADVREPTQPATPTPIASLDTSRPVGRLGCPPAVWEMLP